MFAALAYDREDRGCTAARPRMPIARSANASRRSCNMQQSTRNMQHATDDTQRTTRNTRCNRRRATDDTQHVRDGAHAKRLQVLPILPGVSDPSAHDARALLEYPVSTPRVRLIRAALLHFPTLWPTRTAAEHPLPGFHEPHRSLRRLGRQATAAWARWRAREWHAALSGPNGWDPWGRHASTMRYAASARTVLGASRASSRRCLRTRRWATRSSGRGWYARGPSASC